MTKKLKTEDLPEIEGIDWSQYIQETPKPVNLKLAKIRSTRRLLREIVSDILNIEDENGDSNAEIMLNELVEASKNGNLKATELVIKLLGELDDKQKIDVSVPSIKIVVDSNSEGIRETE